MKKNFFFLIIILSFNCLIAQQKDGLKMQNENESGFIEVDKAPELIKMPTPKYPEEARLQAIEGKVFVKILIDENGNVLKSKIEKGVNSYLDKSALDAVGKAKFKPAILKNKAVRVWVVLPIAFKLDVDKKQEIKNNHEKNVTGRKDLPGPDDMVKVDKLPEVVKSAELVYPEEAKKNKIEGKVYVKALVDEDGNVLKAIVIRSENKIFDDSAIAATKATKFTPAYFENKPLAVWVVLPYKYALDSEKPGAKQKEQK